MTTFLSLGEVSALLNMTEDEIMDLVRQRRLPHRYNDINGVRVYNFVKNEVLETITPRPKKESDPFGPESIKPEVSGVIMPEGSAISFPPSEQPAASKKRGRPKAQ